MNFERLPQDPVFIVGYPRSGTTLLQGLLATQPGIYSLPETHYFNVIEKAISVDDNGNILPACLDTVFEKIGEKMEFQFDEEEKAVIYRLANEKKCTSKTLFECIVAHFLLPRWKGNDLPASFRWLEKTPYHANFLERIAMLYPAVQVLHIVRHPVPAVYSRKWNFPYNKETPVSQLAAHWNHIQQNVERFKEHSPGTVHTLRYEDLVKNPGKELETITAFLNIPFDGAATSRAAQATRPFILPEEPWKQADLKKDGVDTNETYKEVITKADAEVVEKIVSTQMKTYGYHPYFNDSHP